jgi:predicted nucleic acid-binding protein
MGVILDTCIWVEMERRKLTSEDITRLTDNLPVFLTPFVLAELEYGIYRAKTDDQRVQHMDAIMRIRKMPCLAIDKTTAGIFARLTAQLDSVGKPVLHRVHDVWIAASAIQHRYAVLTRNVKDFENIPGIRLLQLP